MPALQDIIINISSVRAGAKARIFRPLIVGTDTVAIAPALYTTLAEIADAFGTDSDEYAMVQSLLSQQIQPTDFAVARKADATSWVDALTGYLDSAPEFYAVLISSREATDLQAVGTWANSSNRFFFGCGDDPSDLGTQGYQAWGFDEAKTGASTTGLLNDATTYGATITIDGNVVNVVVTGSAANTIDDLLDEINADLGSAGLASLTSNAIRITSATAGADSTVSIVDDNVGADEALFATLTDAAATVSTAVVGTGRALDREAYLIHNNAATDYPECALVGSRIGLTPGTAAQGSFKWKVLTGQNPGDWTTSELTLIRNEGESSARGIALQSQKGLGATTNAGCATSGRAISDVIQVDYVKDQIELALLNLLTSVPAVAMDDEGIGQVESVLRTVFSQMSRLGIIGRVGSKEDVQFSDDGQFMWRVRVPRRVDIPLADRANGYLTGVEFDYVRAGEVNRVVINGVVTD
jgi:hypothetical protein